MPKDVVVSRILKILTNDSKFGEYSIFTNDEVDQYKGKIINQLKSFKISLEESVKIDDENDTGLISLENLKETFEVLEIELEQDIMEFLIYWIYRSSTDIDHLKYSALFDLLDQEIIEEAELVEDNQTSEDKKSSDKTSSYGEDFDKDEA